MEQPLAITSLPKAPTGIHGLDEITGGGLPRGRPTLICGGPGCGKTLLAFEILARGAALYGEPGLFISFEESPADLRINVAGLALDVTDLERRKLLLIEQIALDQGEVAEVGEYDLEGLFIRLGLLIDRIGAQRIAIDTIETLFSAFGNRTILRGELQRLFHWLRQRGLTAIITAERTGQELSRFGIEEFVADCVILLDYRINEHVLTRYARIVKYRGSSHGVNEYPFTIGPRGITMLPITSLTLNYPVFTERISSGFPDLDQLLDGGGYYRGSSILVSGPTGSGKTSLGVLFVAAACARGEPAVFFAFEESAEQIVRNVRSIGVDLQPWLDAGLLQIISSRPSLAGLETHLITILDTVERSGARAVVIDPITGFHTISRPVDVTAMLFRLFDGLKSLGVTTLATSLTNAGADPAQSEVNISSLVDTWIVLRNHEANGERNRSLLVLKSRGMRHSNQVRELVMDAQGLKLVEIFATGNEVLVGAARVAEQERLKYERELHAREAIQRQRRYELQRRQLALQIEALQTELAALDEEMQAAASLSEARAQAQLQSRLATTRYRDATKEGSDGR
ncbi:MAG: circadian clock protein KaiC [Chloroflexus sp.]|nr:circadian clock protein KaiC [Chloroflexus sp.]